MITVGLFVRLEAKPGKEAELEVFLRGALSLVHEEPGTTVWSALRFGPASFGIFDALPDDVRRPADLNEAVVAALMARAGELLSAPPTIEKVDALAWKLN